MKWLLKENSSKLGVTDCGVSSKNDDGLNEYDCEWLRAPKCAQYSTAPISEHCTAMHAGVKRLVHGN